MSKASEIMERLDAVDVDHMFDGGKAGYAFLTLDELVDAVLGDEERGCASFQQTFRDVREALREAFAELEARTMPEGYEWPRYEDGEPVCIGNEVHIENEKPYPNFDMLLESITISSSGFSLTGVDGEYVEFRAGERVKRPKVIAADGEPLEVGQTVFMVGNWRRGVVRGFDGDFAIIEYETADVNGGTMSVRTEGACLNHQRPVLDADGVPIHEGDTVWCRVCGGPLTVSKVSEDGTVYVNLDRAHTGDDLTHTKPEIDSWERIEEDAENVAKLFDNFDADASEDIREIVRRCKALAERGEEDER